MVYSYLILVLLIYIVLELNRLGLITDDQRVDCKKYQDQSYYNIAGYRQRKTPLTDKDTAAMKTHLNEKGIYLKFINSVYNKRCFQLSWEVWDDKLKKYHIIGEKFDVNVAYREWYVFFEAPCCDCPNTNGNNYLFQRLE